VWVLDANGKWLGLIETPERPANCTFGGEGYKTLFITAVTSLYAIETQTRGWHIHLDGVPRKK
jgi:gluconolactonase